MDTLDVKATAALREIFPIPVKKDLPLPAEFDDECKNCRKSMVRMHVCYLTRQRPFATFQCQTCKMRLWLFEAPITALLVWSDSLPKALSDAPFFSEMIDERITEREHKREVRAKRQRAAL